MLSRFVFLFVVAVQGFVASATQLAQQGALAVNGDAQAAAFTVDAEARDEKRSVCFVIAARLFLFWRPAVGRCQPHGVDEGIGFGVATTSGRWRPDRAVVAIARHLLLACLAARLAPRSFVGAPWLRR